MGTMSWSWSLLSAVGLVLTFFAYGVPTWLRVAAGALALGCAFGTGACYEWERRRASEGSDV